MLTLNQIKQLMAEYGFRPDKRFGQDFLIDRNIADKIIKFSCINSDDVVLEIGSGLGNITAQIASAAGHVIAVEIDKRIFGVLTKNLSGFSNIEFVRGDILDIDFANYAQKGKIKIIGNLPYYITTPILERIIENKTHIKDALIMVQKEVAQRMLAGPGSKAYSPITCYIQYHTVPELAAIVRRTSFFPQPEVDSALLCLKMRAKPCVAVNNEEMFFKIIKSAFSQRRKMILSSLGYKGVLGADKETIKKVLECSGVSPDRRPETVSLEEFARITNEFAG